MDIVEILNLSFFMCVVVPTFVKSFKSACKFFKLLDCVYDNIWDKLLFCWTFVSFAIKQWRTKTVRKIDKDTYEVSFLIDGRISRIRLTKSTRIIADIQDIETDESYMDLITPYIRFTPIPWAPPKPSLIYYEDGQVESR